MQLCGCTDCENYATIIVTYQFPDERSYDIVRCKFHAKRVLLNAKRDRFAYKVVKHRKICPNE